MGDNDKEFRGKVAVVTAGGSGIGRASAAAFARGGAAVVIGDIDAAAGEDAARGLREAGHRALFVPTDVCEEEQVARLYEETFARFGRIDFCHNNAGGGPSGQGFGMDRDVWDKGLALNLTSVFLCLKHQAPLMARTGGGAIVNTASRAGQRVPPRSSIFYVSAKAAVIHMTKAAALHFAGDGIRVNCVAPGLTGTALTRMSGEEAEKILDHTLLRRAADSEDIAEAVVWLCSEKARMVTGFTMDVDGGAHVV